MPGLELSGDVFTLDASAGFDEGFVRGNVGAGARAKFKTKAEACHGLSLQASATAMANALAELNLLWIVSGRAEGTALASAGAGLTAQATIDPFDSLGVSVDLAAYAEASVAVKLAVALDLQDIANAAAQQLDGPALEIFLALLREVKIGAGVWARLSAAAMIRANASIRLSLADDENAGFLIEAGAGVGLGVGGGVDLYAGAVFESPKRFFLNAVDVVTGTIVSEARKRLPRSLHAHLTALEFVLPAALNAAYEVAQISSVALQARPANAADKFTASFAAELQRFALDKLALAAATLVAGQIDALAFRLDAAALTLAQRQAAIRAVRAAADALQGGSLTLATVNDLLPDLVAALTAMDPAGRSGWRPPLAALWLCLAAGDTVRRGVVARQAQASAGVIGMSTQVVQSVQLSIRGIPVFVQQALTDSLGIPLSGSLDFKTFVAWLIDTNLIPRLRLAVPDTSPFLDMIEHHLDISDVLADALTGDLAATYVKLRRFLVSVLDDLLLGKLFPEIERLLPQGQQARIWCDEVARPSLTMVRNFILDQLDDAAAGKLPTEKQLRAALGLMAGKIVISNVIVLRDIMLDHVRDTAGEAARVASEQIRNGGANPLVDVFAGLAGPLAPALIPPAVTKRASRELAADMLLVIADATGDKVWTDALRARERALLRAILFSAYGEVDVRDPNTTLAKIAACAYLPAPVAVTDMIGLQANALGQTLALTLAPAAQALLRFYATLADGAIEQASGQIAAAIKAIRDQIVAGGRQLEALARRAEAELAEAERLAREAARQLDHVAAACRSSRRREEILNRLRRDGGNNARRAARNAPGFNLLPAGAKNIALNAARDAFRTAFDVVRPILDDALEVLGQISRQIASLFQQAADLAQFLKLLAKAIADKLNQTLTAIAHLPLPSEVDIKNVIDAAVGVVTSLPVIEDALKAAFGARNGERAARNKNAGTLASIKAQNLKLDALEDQLSAGGVGRFKICSPRPHAAAGAGWVYPGAVPIRIAVAGLPDASDQTLKDRIRLFLNGNPVEIPVGAGKARIGTTDHIQFAIPRANPMIRPGANFLECAIVGGSKPAVRSSVMFLVAEQAPTDGLMIRAVNLAKVITVDATPGATVNPDDLKNWLVIDAFGTTHKEAVKVGARLSIEKYSTRSMNVPTNLRNAALIRMVDLQPKQWRFNARPVVSPVGGVPIACRRSIAIIDHLGRLRFELVLGN